MSRQRIRASVLESTMKPCPHCGGTGHVRSEFVGRAACRAGDRGVPAQGFRAATSRCKTPTATALYVLNHKRSQAGRAGAPFRRDDRAGGRRNARRAALRDLPWRRRRKARRLVRRPLRPSAIAYAGARRAGRDRDRRSSSRRSRRQRAERPVRRRTWTKPG